MIVQINTDKHIEGYSRMNEFFSEEVKKEFGFNTITDYHSPAQAEVVAKVVDTLQVPAFLCRQTDMIIAGAKACADNGARLKVKKGQFLSPSDTKNIVDKAKNFLKLEDILLTERGSSFGYNNLVVDIEDYNNSWEVPAFKSWHSRFF